MHFCADNGFRDGAEKLLKTRNLNVDAQDKKGRQTPLYLAAKSGTPDLDLVKLLIEYNADLDHTVRHSLNFGADIVFYVLF